ncbi:hypothetical protein TWF694_006953 [Orbilia ellipsospora]|uniref:DUF7029 domain-containing protein n=1 Tax=Orbilia ellipsospora TaxID=2528407 RepID=A0AAV9XLQ7_9PEZI
MFSSKLLALTLGLFALDASAYPRPGGEDSGSVSRGPKINLLPIRSDELYPHLRKRADDLSSLGFQDKLHLFYAAEDEHSYDTLHLGNMTLARGSRPILLLEDFDALTTDIKCSGDNMSIKFSSIEATEYAQKAWGSVSKTKYFTLITHHEHKGCGQKETRTPFRIVAVDYKPKESTAILTREATNWEKTAENFDFHVGTVEHPVVTSQRILALRARDLSPGQERLVGLTVPGTGLKYYFCNTYGRLWDPFGNCPYYRVESVAVDVVEEIYGPLDSGVQPFKMDKSLGKVKDLIGKPGADTRISCIDCYFKANGNYRAWVKRTDAGQPTVGFFFQPNIDTQLKVKITASPTLPLAQKDFNFGELALRVAVPEYAAQNLVRFLPDAMPGPGIDVRSRISFTVTLGFKLNTGTASIGAGVASQDGSTVEAKNLDTVNLQLIKELNELSVIGEINPYYRLGLGVGVSLFDDSFQAGVFAGWMFYLRNRIEVCMNPATTGAKPKFSFSSEYRVDAGIQVFLSTKFAFNLDWVKTKVVGFLGGTLGWKNIHRKVLIPSKCTGSNWETVTKPDQMLPQKEYTSQELMAAFKKMRARTARVEGKCLLYTGTEPTTETSKDDFGGKPVVLTKDMQYAYKIVTSGEHKDCSKDWSKENLVKLFGPPV